MPPPLSTAPTALFSWLGVETMGALVGANWSKQMRSLILISTLLALPFATAAWSAPPTDSSSKSVTETGFRGVTPPTENENYPYRPCPANVVFPDGHPECLG
jgi:hypothetical protein